MKARLVDIAEAEGVPLSQVIRKILRAWLNDRDAAAKGEPAKAVQIS
jgi:hypothetical protein